MTNSGDSASSDGECDHLCTAPAPSHTGKRMGQRCLQCGATETPQWREGPQGPKTLCNACGVRLMRAAKKKMLNVPQHGVHKSSRKRAATMPQPVEEQDEHMAAQQLLDFASLAASASVSSASEDVDMVPLQVQLDDLSARRSGRKRQRNVRLADNSHEASMWPRQMATADITAQTYEPVQLVTSAQLTISTVRPRATPARFLATRGVDQGLDMDESSSPEAPQVEQQQARPAQQAMDAALVQATSASSYESNGSHTGDQYNDEVPAGSTELISPRLQTMLSATELEQLHHLQRMALVATEHAMRAERERQDMHLQLLLKQAEAAAAHVRLQQESRRLECELQAACMLLTAVASRQVGPSGTLASVLMAAPKPAPTSRR